MVALGGGGASVKAMTSSWPNLSDLMVGAEAPEAFGAPIGLVGAPLGLGSVSPGGCDRAPALLRATLQRIGRYDIDTGRELTSRIADHGNVALDGLTIEAATGPIREAVAASVAAHALTLLIGGNNAVTRPGVHGLGVPLDTIGLITLDAHFDMRETASGLSNGNPVRALIEDGLPGRNIAQIGLAPFANSAAMHRDAVAAGNRILTLAEVERDGISAAVDQALRHVAHCRMLVVDCDIDVIDRSQLPGAPGARPGGMRVADFFAATRTLAREPQLRLIDLTEWDPSLDPGDLSALTAARWVAEVLAGFEAR